MRRHPRRSGSRYRGVLTRQRDFDWEAMAVWQRPTLAEFADRVESQFGDVPDLAALSLVGVGRNERLAPDDIRQLCDQLGVPADLFGVEAA